MTLVQQRMNSGSRAYQHASLFTGAVLSSKVPRNVKWKICPHVSFGCNEKTDSFEVNSGVLVVRSLIPIHVHRCPAVASPWNAFLVVDFAQVLYPLLLNTELLALR